MTQCFRCGDDDHLSYDCPNRTSHTQAPAAPWPAAGAESTKTPMPPPFSSLPRRTSDEIADPSPWAEKIRHDMGWSSEQAEAWRLELARRQAAESRWNRHDFLDR